MRDIRDDLRARRAALVGCYADNMRRLDDDLARLHAERAKIAEDFNSEHATLNAMIELEERRHCAGTSLSAAREPPLSLRDFIIARIEHGGPIDKDSLQKQAIQAGFVENGRAFNMTVQNIATGERIKKLPDGRFAKRDTASLFGMGPVEGGSMTTQ